MSSIEWPVICGGDAWLIPVAYAITALLAFSLGVWGGRG